MQKSAKKRTCRLLKISSVLPPEADIMPTFSNVRFVPKPEVTPQTEGDNGGELKPMVHFQSSRLTGPVTRRRSSSAAISSMKAK
jgi:hypothetical protein